MCVNVDSPVLQQVISDGVPSCYTAAYIDHFTIIVIKNYCQLFAPKKFFNKEVQVIKIKITGVWNSN